MIDRQTIEMTLLQIARQKGKLLERFTLYTVKNDLRNTPAAK